MTTRLCFLLGCLAVAGLSCANDTNIAPGRLVVQATYGSSPTCTGATADGSICAETAITSSGTLRSIGAATLASASITGAATVGSTLGVTGVTTTTGGLVSTAGTTNINVITPTATSVDFTIQPQVPFFAKTTLAIMTEADTQEDLFRVGIPPRYFEIFQDGNNTDNVGGWVSGATGWVIPGPNAADQGMQLTEGIVLGSAHSFTAGTTAAFKVRAAFLIPTRAQIADLMVGFRKLGAYVVADDATELATAYDDKILAGIDGNAGVTHQLTSKATVDVTTHCTATAHADGDILAVEVNVSAAGVTSVKFGAATPAGGTTAQTQAAVTAAYAALAADALCNAAAITLTAGEYVPTIAWASAAGVSTVVLANYYAGPQ